MNKKTSLILLILWMIMIFVFSQMDSESSELLSQGATSFLLRLKDLLLIKKYDVVIRKIAHVFEYLILAFLSYNYFRFVLQDYKKVILYSFILSFVYACSDEVHQLFIPGRSCEFIDILIDMIGVFIVLGLLFIKKSNASKRKGS